MDELSQHLWDAPYRKMAAIEEHSEGNYLLDIYSRCHIKKFKTKPIWPLGNAHLTLIQDIRKLAGDKAPELIEHFFKMSNDWFQKQGYSLDVLKKSINIVNSDFQKNGNQVIETQALKICVRVHCDHCGIVEEWSGYKEELLGPKERVCDKCRP